MAPIIVKLISNGVGLATEAYAARKAKKQASASSSSPSPGPEQSIDAQYVELPAEQAQGLIQSGQAVPVGTRETQGIHRDDEIWTLDEVAELENSQVYELEGSAVETDEGGLQVVDENLVHSLVDNLPPPVPHTRLPCPVVLPQRRPREKSRGFVRAYAPVLKDSGIDEATFLNFLKTFHQASQASPIFKVILLGTFAAGFVPSVIAMATTAAINAVVIPAAITQSRYRTNSFLDDANEKLFKPRGLYAMIVAYKPDADRPVAAQAMDINATIMKYSQSSGSRTKDGLRSLRMSSGRTYGEIEMPQAAELVFPALEVVSEDQEQKSRLKRSSQFVADYYDRRAQAEFLKQNPDSSLTAEKPQFAHSWADPNHPAYQGGLITLATGGLVRPNDSGGLLGAGRGLLLGELRVGRGRSGAEREGFGRGRGGVGLGEGRGRLGANREQLPDLIGTVKKAITQDVLYLMIVNLPTEEELAQARVQLEQAQAQQRS